METMEQSLSWNQNLNDSVINTYKPNRFSLPQPSFFETIDHKLKWFPEQLLPWFYLNSFKDLSLDSQLRYNHLYALAAHEIFMTFELDFLNTILNKVSKNTNVSAPFSEVLLQFANEEVKHAKMFYLLNQKAGPSFYNSKQRHYFINKADIVGSFLLYIIKKFPNFFGVWVWMALYFEEKTLLYSKYFAADKNDQIDSVFKEVHRLHLLEEVQHVKLDEVLVHQFYKPLPWWKKKLAAVMFLRIIKSFKSPRRISKIFSKILISEFPAEKIQIKNCMSELRDLPLSEGYNQVLFGKNAVFRLKKLLSQFPEFKSVLNEMEKNMKLSS